MAVRTDLQPKRKRLGLGDIDKGNPFKKLRESKRKKRRAKKDVENLHKILKDPSIREGLDISDKAFERAVRQGVSEGVSGSGVKIRFKKRKKLILEELK